jgi:hypothetical protein
MAEGEDGTGAMLAFSVAGYTLSTELLTTLKEQGLASHDCQRAGSHPGGPRVDRRRDPASDLPAGRPGARSPARLMGSSAARPRGSAALGDRGRLLRLAAMGDVAIAAERR